MNKTAVIIYISVNLIILSIWTYETLKSLNIKKYIVYLFQKEQFSERDLIFKLFKGHRGVMIDVGAHYGWSFIDFAKVGWLIYCFEPDDNNRQKLNKNIKKHNLSNVTVESEAISNKATKSLLYNSDISSGISSLISFHSSHKKYKEVDVITLSSYCREHNISKIDFLKIDTEGNDLNVLKGLDLLPSVILCEYEDSKTKLIGYTKEDMVQYLSNRGYCCYISEWYPIINYGESHKWKRLTTDIKTVDNNSWGNIIALQLKIKL